MPRPRQYWDHSSVVDWSGAAQDFRVPAERVLVAPVQWLFATRVRMCCTPFDCIYLRAADGREARSCFQPRPSRPAPAQASGQEHRPACCAPGADRHLPRLRRNMSVPTTSPLAPTPRCAPLEAAALLVEGRTVAPSRRTVSRSVKHPRPPANGAHGPAVIPAYFGYTVGVFIFILACFCVFHCAN